MKWVKLPSGEWINLATVCQVIPKGDDLCVFFGQENTPAYVTRGDVPALLAALEREAAPVAVPVSPDNDLAPDTWGEVRDVKITVDTPIKPAPERADELAKLKAVAEAAREYIGSHAGYEQANRDNLCAMLRRLDRK